MKKSGVYKIMNVQSETTKMYVGSSVDLDNRRRQHFYCLKNNKHTNNYLQNAYNKYGKDNFKCEIIEYIEFNENKELLKERLMEREQYWIDELGKTYELYNLCPVAGSRLGSKQSPEVVERIRKANTGKKRSEEFKIMLRALLKGKKKSVPSWNLGIPLSEERRERIRQANLGKKQSKETIAKRRESLKGYIHSDETKEKIRKANTGKKRSEEIRRCISETNRKRPLEVIDKIRQANLGRKQSQETIDKRRESIMNGESPGKRKIRNMDTDMTFNSINVAARFYNLESRNIGKVCRGERRMCGGYHWEYII